MSNQPEPPQRQDALDELADALLDCGAVLSQIVSHMVEFQASGRAAPDAAPIPEITHSLIRDVLDGIRKQHSRRDIRVAGTIVAQATEEISENVFFVGPDST